jgi:hypothetical protein
MKTCVLAVSACLYLMSAPAAWGGAISIVDGKIGAKEFGPTAVSGPGAVCAHARIEATGETAPAAGKGDKCHNDIKIGPNKDEPIIDKKLTEAIGSALKGTVGLKLMNKSDEEVGQSIFYDFDKFDDKPKAVPNKGNAANILALARIGSQPTASASHDVANKDGKIEGEGLANTNAPGRGQFAAAIINDPLVFQADSSTLDPLVEFTLGSQLSLQATEPGDLALALFQIWQDATTVLDFALEVTLATTSALQTLHPLDCSTTLLGNVSSCQAYLTQFVLPFLHWDSDMHMLTATQDITLYRMLVPSDGTNMKGTYNFAAVAATPVREPAMPFLMIEGLIVLALPGSRRSLLSCGAVRGHGAVST